MCYQAPPLPSPNGRGEQIANVGEADEGVVLPVKLKRGERTAQQKLRLLSRFNAQLVLRGPFDQVSI